MHLEPVVAPLEGLKVDVAGQGLAFDVAAWLLGGMGASISRTGRHVCGIIDARIAPASPWAPTACGATLRPSPVRLDGGGLPEGCLDYATGLALAAGAIAGWLSSSDIGVDEVAVAVEVRLPDVMAASYSATNPMRPAPPRSAPGGGFYHADLGAPGAADDFDRLVGILGPDTSARLLASASQEWRLAVCDYRPWNAASRRDHSTGPEAHKSVNHQPIRFEQSPVEGRMSPACSPSGISPPARRRRLGRGIGIAVLDMTTMWAGPLATRLLEQLGAEITKVEPTFRPDGTRALDGGGIYPGDEQIDPGRDSAMWNALNWDKRHVDLDLRNPAHMQRFVALAHTCDVVIESFSPRVIANFDIPARILGTALLVSMPAFGPGPQRDWVAYGSGVHAQSGLGHVAVGALAPGRPRWGESHTNGVAPAEAATREDRFVEPAVSYPDPLAGLTAALGVLAGLAAKALGVRVERVEVSLDEAIHPLVAGIGVLGSPGARPASRDGHPSTSLLRRGDGQGAVLLGHALDLGLTVPRLVANRWLDHPAGPFRVLS